MAILAIQIKSLRGDTGLTQDEFASRLNMHGRQLARYETGRVTPSMEVIKKIADFCEVSIDYLIYGRDPKLANRSKIKDVKLLELLRKIDRLKKPKRERLTWAIESLLNNST